MNVELHEDVEDLLRWSRSKEYAAIQDQIS